MSRLHARSLVLTVVFSAALAGGCAGRGPGSEASALDLEGSAVDPLGHGARATVLVFVASDCPISNRYAPEIRRIHDEFAARGVATWLVYPNAADTPEKVRRHLADFGHPAPALRDPRHVLVRRAGATRTPEAALFAADGSLVYLGRIDDSFVAFGKMRPEPTVHDLREALAATLSGERAPLSTTQAIGCTIAPAE